MKKTKFAEEKSKGSKALSVVIIVLLVFLAIFAVSFGESHLSSKSDKQVSVGQLDASSEPMVEQTKLYREYNGDGFILSLTEQGDYVLVGNDATYQFTGKYVVKRGQEAIQAVGEDTIKKAGLNPKKSTRTTCMQSVVIIMSITSKAEQNIIMVKFKMLMIVLFIS